MKEELVEKAARAAHEANRAYCGTMGDYSQESWEEAPKWQRDSCRQGVRFVLENPDCLPEDQHENWMREKLVQGWKYGPVKDVTRKEHPCMVTYQDLPLSQRVKDSIFQAVVRTVYSELDKAGV
jgi:hypothetical protein